jgi:hypothetical protein
MLPAGYRMSTRRLIHAQSDTVHQIWHGSTLIAERLSVIDAADAAWLIKNHATANPTKGQRFESEVE